MEAISDYKLTEDEFFDRFKKWGGKRYNIVRVAQDKATIEFEGFSSEVHLVTDLYLVRFLSYVELEINDNIRVLKKCNELNLSPNNVFIKFLVLPEDPNFSTTVCAVYDMCYSNEFLYDRLFEDIGFCAFKAKNMLRDEFSHFKPSGLFHQHISNDF